MGADLVRKLILAHIEGDQAAFRKAALQIAATESSAGHIRVAEELRKLISTLRPETQRVSMPVDISQPRGELAGLLEGGFCQERKKDIILSLETLDPLLRVLRENRERSELESWGVRPSRRLLFFGPPGCGKTLAARVLAGELGLPLMTVRFDALFSRFLGATANHLKVIFDEMPRRPAVYFFDEFDAVGKFRGDSQDVGEVRRVVTSFLQLMDADKSNSVIISATNYEEILDRAIFRRFDLALSFQYPSAEQLAQLIRLHLGTFRISDDVVDEVSRRTTELSFADAARACDNAIKTMVLDRRRNLDPKDVRDSFEQAKRRNLISGTSDMGLPKKSGNAK